MATERRSFEVSVIGPAVVRRCERVKSEGDKGLSMFRFSLIYQNGHLQPDTGWGQLCRLILTGQVIRLLESRVGSASYNHGWYGGGWVESTAWMRRIALSW